VRLHRQHAQRLPRGQQRAEGRRHDRFAVPGGHLEQPQILAVRTPRLLDQQPVIRLAKRHRGEQVLAIAVARERPRLPDQAVDDMAIIDPVLVLTAQPGHGLHRPPRIPDLDLLGTDAHLNTLADQPRRHRVAVALDAHRAAPPDLHGQPFLRLQPSGR
jgi:hypothetical protein